MQHPIPLVDGVLFIDNSSLERFTTCQRSAEYYLCYKRESADDREALIFGKILHSILEPRYEDLSRPLEETRRLMHARCEQAFASWSPPEGSHRNYGAMTTLIDSYLETYPIEEFKVLQLPSGRPAVELPFAVPIGELDVQAELAVRLPDATVENRFVEKLPVVWTGRIDLIYESQGRLYVMDHKSTSMMGPGFFKEFEISHQVYGYVWAAAQLLRRSINGFAINAIAIRKPTKTGKALEFVRQIITLEQTLLDEWITDTMHLCADFVEAARRGYFAKCTKWCVAKYGECPYRPVCGLPTNQREMMLMSGMYKTVEWSPLK